MNHHSSMFVANVERVRALCVAYDLPYTTGHLVRQYLMTVRTVGKLALPNGSFTAPSPVETRHRVTAEYA